ncbi:MAG TPA: hypothetical protein VM925_26900 [Labilithrix sp.]|nr:hypothetical protein [Labilithrix sp.]
MRSALVPATAFVSLVFAACSFPDPILADVDASRPASPDGSVAAPADASDEVAERDAGSPPSGSCKNPCDCDEDGEPSKAAGCGGNDCDDQDPSRHPGVDFSTTPPVPPKTWDYDCSGTEDKPTTNVQCGGRGVAECTLPGGFKGNPGCGQPAVFVTCRVAAGGNTCEEDTLDTSGVMPCR